MEAQTSYCQSCSMPLDSAESRGTEKNGMPSTEYCKYCYQNGAFLNPAMTLDEMRSIVKNQMERRNIPVDTIEKSINILPQLKRWSPNLVS